TRRRPPGTVWTPVEAPDRPGSVGQLSDRSTSDLHDVQMYPPTVEEAASVTLVVQASRHPRHRRAPDLVRDLRRAGIVDDRCRLGELARQGGDVPAVRSPAEGGYAVRQARELPRRPALA